MINRKIETMILFPMDRGLPPAYLNQVAQVIKDSNVVDYFHISDQLQGWFPPSLWTDENTSFRALLPDADANADPFAMGAFAAASAPGIGLTLSTDAIRRGPAEMMQGMLTMANFGSGRAILQLGAGEIKNTAPYGWQRKEGLRRLEDHLRFYSAFWQDDQRINLDGHFWSYKDATIGSSRNLRPRMWALGGGPKLIDLATRYADGFSTMVPNVIPTPEKFHEFVKKTRSSLEQYGRNPDDFDFGPWTFVFIHEDRDVIRKAFTNPLIKWIAAIFGRFNNTDWSSYGLEGAFPNDWHYANQLLPSWYTDPNFVNDILARVTPEMCELTFLCGDTQEVAAKIRPYIEAGATHIDLIDMGAAVLDPIDAQKHLARQIEVCRLLKQSA